MENRQKKKERNEGAHAPIIFHQSESASRRRVKNKIRGLRCKSCESSKGWKLYEWPVYGAVLRGLIAAVMEDFDFHARGGEERGR